MSSIRSALTRWWRSLYDITIGDQHVVLAAAERGEYAIVIDGTAHKVKSRWYDGRITIAWKLRRMIRRAGVA